MTVIQNVIARLSNVTCVTNYRYNIVNRISTSVFQYTPKQSVEEKLGIKPRPKRPYTPFLRFSLQQRTSVIQQNPQANQKDILKLIAEEWKNVDESVKSQLQAQFKKEWLKYLEDCKEYDKLLSPVDREEIAKAKEEAKTVKEKRILRKTKKDLGCPKKPGSSYVYFMKSKLPERGDTPFKEEAESKKILEFQQKIKAEWEKLPELQKDRFEQLYKKDMEDYREKMSLWTKKMNEEGHSFSTKKQRVGPKRPASSYFHFLRSKLLHRGETPFKEYQKKVREEWEKLPPNEKKKYEDMYKREMEEYKTLKADWSEGQKAKTGEMKLSNAMTDSLNLHKLNSNELSAEKVKPGVEPEDQQREERPELQKDRLAQEETISLQPEGQILSQPPKDVDKNSVPTVIQKTATFQESKHSQLKTKQFVKVSLLVISTLACSFLIYLLVCY